MGKTNLFLGIGYQAAKWIAMMGATVIIACRSEDKSMEVCIIKFQKNIFSVVYYEMQSVYHNPR